jgi:hypothetical protein
MESQTLAVLFKESPKQWGYRGDANLWQALQIKVLSMPMPQNLAKLRELVRELFEELVGEPLVAGEVYYVKKLDTGGMSGGMVLCNYWLLKVIPMLEVRYVVLNLRS